MFGNILVLSDNNDLFCKINLLPVQKKVRSVDLYAIQRPKYS